MIAIPKTVTSNDKVNMSKPIIVDNKSSTEESTASHMVEIDPSTIKITNTEMPIKFEEVKTLDEVRIKQKMIESMLLEELMKPTILTSKQRKAREAAKRAKLARRKNRHK